MKRSPISRRTLVRRSLAIPRMGLPLGALALALALAMALAMALALGKSVFVMGGSVDCAFDAGASILSQARQGKVRLIGVTSPTRLPSSPDVPTFIEQGLAGFESRVWSGLFVPAGTPERAVQRLNQAVNYMFREPGFTDFNHRSSGEPAGGSSEALASFLSEEIAKWAPVLRESCAQVD